MRSTLSHVHVARRRPSGLKMADTGAPPPLILAIHVPLPLGRPRLVTEKIPNSRKLRPAGGIQTPVLGTRKRRRTVPDAASVRFNALVSSSDNDRCANLTPQARIPPLPGIAAVDFHALDSNREPSTAIATT